MNEWIDCKDRMPPCGEFVIAYCAHAPIWSIVRWGGCEWVESTEEWHRYPRDFYSHWMPRPESPEPPKPAGPFSADKKFCKDCEIYFWDRYKAPCTPSISVAGISSEVADALVKWLNRLWANK